MMNEQTLHGTHNHDEIDRLIIIAINQAEPYPNVEIQSVSEVLAPDSPLFLYHGETEFLFFEKHDNLNVEWESGIEPLMDRFDDAWRQLANQ